MKKMICVAAAMLLVFMPATVQAWGPEGHEIVGTLAEAMLSNTAKAGVQSILGTATLASVSNWADQIRQARQETYNWHFVDIPRSAATFDDARDCFKPTDTHPGAATDHINCAVDRITFFKQVLADTTKTATERQEFRWRCAPAISCGRRRTRRKRQSHHGVRIDTMREPPVQSPLRMGQRDDHTHGHGRERVHTTLATVDHGESHDGERESRGLGE